MQISYLLISVLATAVSAQTLTSVLSANNATLSTLSSLLAAQPALVSTLSTAKNITILAPNNAAFKNWMGTKIGEEVAKMPDMVTALLEYHVLKATVPSTAIMATPAFVPTYLSNATYSNVTGGQVVEAVKMGGMVMIYSGLRMNSTVVTADIKFDGGIIHVIDTVLMIPTTDTVTAEVLGLSSLAGALQKANLGALNGLADVTIFAPTNAAFQAIGATAETLSITDLASILEYHVVQNTVGYSSLLKTETLGALSGQKLMVQVTGGKVFVNSAQVILADVLVSNGVVHVIDNVLNPNNTMAMPATTASTQSVAFAGASSATLPPFTSGIVTGIDAVATMNAAPEVRIPAGSLSMGALLGGAFMLIAGM